MALVSRAWKRPWEQGDLIHDRDFGSQDVPPLAPAAMGTLHPFSYPQGDQTWSVRTKSLQETSDGHSLFQLCPMLLAGVMWLSRALCYVLIL